MRRKFLRSLVYFLLCWLIWKTPFRNIQGTFKICLKYIAWNSTPQSGRKSDHNKEEKKQKMLIKWKLICWEDRCWTHEKRLVTNNCAQPLFPQPHGFLLYFFNSVTASEFLRELHKKWEGNGTPLQYSCLENPMDGGAW